MRDVKNFDFIIVGSGFGGSIMAMILRRHRKSVAMLEKGKHPRFAIGESSTPLANLLLEELARKYDLPDLAALSKWGSWQAKHPEIGCGLKRGFTFYKHEWNRSVDFADRDRQLLVAASPRDEIADTHWYRPDFDGFLARKAAELGAELVEGAQFQLSQNDGEWIARGPNVEVTAPFLIDASGPRGCLFKYFGFEDVSAFPPTESLFAHFECVKRLHSLEAKAAEDSRTPKPGGFQECDGERDSVLECGCPLPLLSPPYPPDDAALHHVFEGGWIWVLRFNNGITSAGAAVTSELAKGLRLSEGETAWPRLLERLPTVKSQFAEARAITPFFYQPRIAFRSPQAVDASWAMLPSTAGFVDPLFSTGFVLNLLGIERLAKFFSRDSAVQLSEDDAAYYGHITFAELSATEQLVASAYNAFSDFPRFINISRKYFAAAIWSETLRRLGRKPPAFLLCDQSQFKVEDIDLGGLTDPSRRNWFPAQAADLFANAHKIPASHAEIASMLHRCGF